MKVVQFSRRSISVHWAIARCRLISAQSTPCLRPCVVERERCLSRPCQRWTCGGASAGARWFVVTRPDPASRNVRAAPRGVAAIRPRNVRAAPRGVKRRNASFQKTRLPPSRASSRRAPRADGKLLGAARVVDGAESIAVSSRGAVRAASRERVVRTGVAGRDDRMVAQRRQRSDLWAASSDALTSPPGRRGEGSRASGPRIAVRRVQNAFEPLFLRRPPGDVSSEGAAAVAALPQGPWAALRAFRVTAFTEI